MALALVVLVRPKAVPPRGPLLGATTHRVAVGLLSDGWPAVCLSQTTPAVPDESTVRRSSFGAAIDARPLDVDLNARTHQALPRAGAMPHHVEGFVADHTPDAPQHACRHQLRP